MEVLKAATQQKPQSRTEGVVWVGTEEEHRDGNYENRGSALLHQVS